MAEEQQQQNDPSNPNKVSPGTNEQPIVSEGDAAQSHASSADHADPTPAPEGQGTVPHEAGSGNAYTAPGARQTTVLGSDEDRLKADQAARGEQTQQSEAAGGGQAETPDEFENMTVTELEAYADENGIDLGDATRKADIQEKLRADRAAKANK